MSNKDIKSMSNSELLERLVDDHNKEIIDEISRRLNAYKVYAPGYGVITITRGEEE